MAAMSTSADRPKRVFISYSQGPAERNSRIRALADRLRGDGIDARIDQYEQFPKEGWPVWMDRQIDEAEFVLIICTEDYCAKASRKVPGGKGVKFESFLTYDDLVESATENTKFIPVLFSDEDRQHRPKPLRSFQYFVVGTDEGYVRLLRLLTGNPEITAPPIGASPDLPSGRAATVLSAPYQLPTPPADFTGREKELDELRKAIRSGNVAISGLKGMGGVGKTALALVLADEMKPYYPDGQIYLDLLGTTTPFSPAKAMEHVIRSFHPDSKLPEDAAQISPLYHSVLTDKKVLLLMDNARDSKQVEPLIPPRGCFLFVTSRQHIELPGLHATRLDTLPPKDAENLLLSICRRITDKAGALAKACGYLPLALRLAASALNEHETISVESYLERLSDTARKSKELAEPALATSYDLLSDDTKRAWRQLAVFPSTFDSAAAAAVWGVGLETAEDLLGALVSFSLVEWNPQARRAHLHDLARDFATSRLNGDPQEERAARLRHAAHYASVIRAADDTYDKGGDNVLKGLAFFDLERTNIETGFKWACVSLDADDAAKVCNDYGCAWSILELRQHPGAERIPWFEAALAAARMLSDRQSEGNHLCGLGLAYADLGDARKAIEHYEKHLAIAREIGDRGGEGAALNNLGLAYADLGDARKAIEYYEQYLAIAREIGNRRGEGIALGNLGNAYKNLGDARKAIEYYEQYLAIAREIGFRRGEGNALGSLGLAYAHLGDTRKAIEYYEKRISIAREIGDRRGEGAALGNLGVAYKNLGDARKAIEYYERRIAIAREIGDRRGECTALYNMASQLYKLGRRAEAIPLAEASLAIHEAIEDPWTPNVRALLKELKSSS